MPCLPTPARLANVLSTTSSLTSLPRVMTRLPRLTRLLLAFGSAHAAATSSSNDITTCCNVDDEPTHQAHRRSVQRRTRPPPLARQTRGAQRRPASQSHTKLVTHSARRGRGGSLTGAGWQAKEILGERQTDVGFMYEVMEGKGRETRTIWLCWADLDPELLEGLLKRFKVGQRSMRYKARSTLRR